MKRRVSWNSYNPNESGEVHDMDYDGGSDE